MEAAIKERDAAIAASMGPPRELFISEKE